MEAHRPRGRAQDYDHGRISWRQPVAHQPCHLWRGHAIRGRLQSEPRPDPRSKSYISRPDLCPSLESALKRGNRVSQRGPMALTVYAKTGSDTPHTSRLLRMLALRQLRTAAQVAAMKNDPVVEWKPSRTVRTTISLMIAPPLRPTSRANRSSYWHSNSEFHRSATPARARSPLVPRSSMLRDAASQVPRYAR